VVKRGMILLVIGAVAILGACGSQNEGPEPTVTRIPNPPNAPATPAPTTPATTPAGSPVVSPTAPAPPTTVQVTMHDIFFDPKELTIPANTDVTITLVNQGAATHTFDIDALNIHSGEVPAGGTATVTIHAAAGDYEYYCAIPGHKEAGMVGTLHVVEGAAPPAGSPEVSPTAAPGASPTGGAVALVGDVERGKSLAAQCMTCHSIDGRTIVGPTWKGLYGSQVELESGETVVANDAYLHQSIVDPASQIVKGFPPAMPPYNYLTEQQIADLIAYIKSLQ
jgi:cytochrome c oxidase subunit 2